MSIEESYHHGITIRKYRQKAGITQAILAEHWPNGPVTQKYVQKVESGERKITDQALLRHIGMFLGMPLWELGLSEYDPFNTSSLPGKGERVYSETLDTIEYLIQQTWFLRRVAPVPETEKSVRRLLSIFKLLQTNTPPALQLEKRYLQLFAQAHRLKAIVQIEKKEYKKAIDSYGNMLSIAKAIDDAAGIAIALLGMGAELERLGKQQDAVDSLENARDAAFQSSKEIAALVNSYLARTYASIGDTSRFKRAIDTAQSIAINLGDNFGNERDYAFYSMSGILAERSYGYLEINEPEKTLALRHELSKTIVLNENTWLYAWIPLDWARAYMLTGEIEESVKEAREFFHRATMLKSSHIISRAYAFEDALEQRGFRDVIAVQEFKEELEQGKRGNIVIER